MIDALELLEALRVQRGETGALTAGEATRKLLAWCEQMVRTLAPSECDELVLEEVVARVRLAVLTPTTAPFRGASPGEAMSWLRTVVRSKLLDVWRSASYRNRAQEFAAAESVGEAEGGYLTASPERVLRRLCRRIQLLAGKRYESIALFIERRVSPHGGGKPNGRRSFDVRERNRVDKKCQRGGEYLRALAPELEDQLEEAEELVLHRLLSVTRRTLVSPGEE